MSIAGKRFIGIALEEAIYGDPVAAEEYLCAVDEALSEDPSTIHPETGCAGREEMQGIPGAYKCTGPFSLPVDSESLTKLLRLLLGDYGTIGEPKLEGTTPGDTVLDLDVAVGATVIPVADTTNFTIGDFMVIGVGELSEFRKISAVNAGVSLETLLPVRYAHDGTGTPERVYELDLGTQIDVSSPAGAKVLNVDAETGFSTNDYVQVGDGYNAECCKVASTASGTITVVDNLLYTHAIDENVVLLTGKAFMHKFKAGSSIKSTTLEDCPGVADKSRQFAGTIIKSIALAAPKMDYLSATIETVSKKPKLITSTVPTIAQLTKPRTFVFYEDTPTIADEAAPKVSAWTGKYENVIDEDNFNHGDRFLGGIVLGGGNFEGEIELVFQTWEMHQRFWGGKTLTEPASGSAAIPTYLLRFDFIGVAIADTEEDGGFENHEFDVYIPNVELVKSEPPWDRREPITQTVGWKAIVKDEVYAVEFRIVNTKYRP